jgi:hypothetical protein
MHKTGDEYKIRIGRRITKQDFRFRLAPFSLIVIRSFSILFCFPGQYFYAYVFDQQVKKYGRTRKAAQETVRICKDRGVLKEYLGAHEKEVVSSMIMLFEQEEATKRYGSGMKSEGRNEGKIAAYAEMVAEGDLTVEKAAKKLNMTVDEFNEAVEALKVTA